MGVPAFYRWLSEKYPKIVVHMLEEKPVYVEGVRVPTDMTKPNPNGVEFDNLYVDMNGIIHPCAHPEGSAQPETEEDMYINIFEYLDRLMNAVRPRRLLYLAVDGVAPRAKMNQQRSRRFRAAQEAEELREIQQEVRTEMADMGVKIPPPTKEPWDSNVITPGTPFMTRLSVFLHYYVQHRTNTDKAWRGIKVILSDASQPGEGEHKIMEYIRQQRTQPGYDPNQHHILHGLDADLIMLGLATHEPKFTVLRELVTFGRKDKEKKEAAIRAQQAAYEATMGNASVDDSAMEDGPDADLSLKPLQMLRIWVLREYLQVEFACLERSLPFPYDFERVVDDFVFLCFFVGNDFLPHLPSLDIRDGALDYLQNVYKRCLPAIGDYLTAEGGDVNLQGVAVIMAEVGDIEDEVFRRRRINEERDQARKSQNNQMRKAGGKGRVGAAFAREEAVAVSSVVTERNKDAKARLAIVEQKAKEKDSNTGSQDLSSNLEAAEKLRQKLQGAGSKKKKKKKSTKAKASSKEGEILELEEEEEEQFQEEEEVEGEEDANEGAGFIGDTDQEQEVSAAGAGKRKRPADGKEVADDDVDGNTCRNGIGGDGEYDEALGADDVEENREEDPDLHTEDVVHAIRASGAVEVQVAEADLKSRVKDRMQSQLDKHREDVVDNVRLWEVGWKDRYYSDKCKLEDIEAGGGRERIKRAYVEGLCWVMNYYYKGVTDWTWYYPFHYSPFASDLTDCDSFEIKFTQSEPFRPIEQLMAVLPPASSHALPEPCRKLMIDSDSPVVDFYPKDVPVDPNGKPMPWLWVVLLPFIDQDRLLKTMRPLYDKFRKEEVERNTFGPCYVFAHSSHSLFEKLDAVFNGESGSLWVPATETDGWSGTLAKVPPSCPSASIGAELVAPKAPLRRRLSNVANNQVACAVYIAPPRLPHVCRFLPGTIPMPPILLPQDSVPQKPPRLTRFGLTISEFGKTSARNGNSLLNGQNYRAQPQSHPAQQQWYPPSQPGAWNNQYIPPPQAQGGLNQFQQPQWPPQPYQNQQYQYQYQQQQQYTHPMHMPTGARGWGTMEPTPKRRHQSPAGFGTLNPAHSFPPPSASQPLPSASAPTLDALRSQLLNTLNKKKAGHGQQQQQQQSGQQGRGFSFNNSGTWR